MIIKNSSELTTELATRLINEYGVAVFNNFVKHDQLIGLNDEFDKAFVLPQAGIQKIDLEVGRGVIFSKALVNSEKNPVTLKTFSSTLMNDIAFQYWKQPFELNKQIYFMNEIVGTTHVAMEMHFDVLPTFKFFIYLTETTKENGAFACVPGSQKIAYDIRKGMGNKISHEQREVTRKIPFGEEEVFYVEGEAGTLIIFTTEVFHRAGKVSKGERRIMRGHNRP
jgi:hypothetical protein